MSSKRSPAAANASERATEQVRAVFAESIRVKQLTMDSCSPGIASAAERLVDAFRAGKKVLLFGNGGSASDAQHIAGEWVGRLGRDRGALPAIALGADAAQGLPAAVVLAL